MVTAKAFARRATREIQHYRRHMKGFAAQAVVRDDIYTGLLSTGGNLYIGRETTVAAHRVEGLLQHEVGTHLVDLLQRPGPAVAAAEGRTGRLRRACRKDWPCCRSTWSAD